MMATATYTYPGAPACLCCPDHVCAYVCAHEVFGSVGDAAWHTEGDTAEQAVARYLANRALSSNTTATTTSGGAAEKQEAQKKKKREDDEAKKKKAAKAVIACAACDKTCVVYANNQRPYPLVNPVTGKPSPLHNEMALVCSTCAFAEEMMDVRRKNAFFMCLQCTAHTHAGLAAAKR